MADSKKLLDYVRRRLAASEKAATTKSRNVGELLGLDRVKKKVVLQTKRSFLGEISATKHLRRLPKSGETLHAITTGEFTGADIIPAMIAMDESAVVECYLTTLSFSRQNVDLLCSLIDKKRVRNLTLLASVYFRRTRGNEEVYLYAAKELQSRKSKVLSARVHAKLILLKTKSGKHFVVETSGNLRSCLCVEQLSISDDAALYRFHRQWIKHVVRITSEANDKPR